MPGLIKLLDKQSAAAVQKLTACRAMVVMAVAATLAAVMAPAAASAADGDGTLDLSRYRGKVVYVDFWASWCVPCRQAFGFLEALRMRYEPKDLVIITINVDRDHKAAENFLRVVGGGLPVVYDPKGAIAARFGVAAMPTSFVIDRAGHQRFVHRGYFDSHDGEYDRHVAALVAEHG